MFIPSASIKCIVYFFSADIDFGSKNLTCKFGPRAEMVNKRWPDADKPVTRGRTRRFIMYSPRAGLFYLTNSAVVGVRGSDTCLDVCHIPMSSVRSGVRLCGPLSGRRPVESGQYPSIRWTPLNDPRMRHVGNLWTHNGRGLWTKYSQEIS